MKTIMLAVGISDYANPQIDDLTVCHDDARRMVEAWQAAAGGEFASKLIVNAEATKQGIEAGVRWLAETAGPGDLALFYYSGHGASFDDDSGDEKDNKDEFLCPHDCGLEQGYGSFIRDDELKQWLAAVGAKTDRVVLIFDACHSGTANAAPVEATAKELPTDLVAGLLAGAAPPPAPPVDPSLVANQILLAGCEDYQQSFILNGHDHSLFTAALLAALEDSSVTTIQGLFRAAAAAAQEQADMANINQSPKLSDGAPGEVAF
ncbi:MAG TPA: caspase family protein, partial [Herpetosiphonaceae bacterium]